MKLLQGTWKIEEIEELSKFGASLPPDMQGLTSHQVSELNLKDEWVDKHLNSSEYVLRPDPMGRRNGFAPVEKYAVILTKTIADAKTRISKTLVNSDACLTKSFVTECLDIIKGAITICYPMGLPSYDIIQSELEGNEDLSGTQAGKEVLVHNKVDIWWANKLLDKAKLLSDYVGKNEKSKLIVKIQKTGEGAPSREPVFSEQERKDLMLAEYRRREELKKLEENLDDTHLDSEWADNNQLKKSYIGLSKIKFK